MRILMATHYFGSHRGGIEIVAEKLFHELASLEQEVVWTASDVTPSPQTNGVSRAVAMPVFNFVERKLGLPFPIPKPQGIAKLWKELQAADVLILHDCLYLTNILAFLFARLRRIPVMIVQHIGIVPYRNGILLALMQLANALVTRPMLKNAQQTVFISDTVRNYFAGIPFKRPAEVIFNGVDTKVFQAPLAGEKKEDLRSSFGLPTDRPVILFVGRFVEKKGLIILKRMVQMAPQYCWVFAGWGPLDPRQWNAPSVHVFSDVRGRDLAKLYRASDVFILPSIGEGFPLVIQEALASGLPVICESETTKADPAILPFVYGVSLERGDPPHTAEQFLAAIRNLVGSDAMLVQRAEKRRAFALERYSWRRATERYLNLASELLSQRTGFVAEPEQPAQSTIRFVYKAKQPWRARARS